MKKLVKEENIIIFKSEKIMKRCKIWDAIIYSSSKYSFNKHIRHEMRHWRYKVKQKVIYDLPLSRQNQKILIKSLFKKKSGDDQE